MRIDVIIESDKTPDEVIKLGRLAEELGLGGVWVANNANGRDAFVNFTPLALQTKKIAIGPIAVSPQELHPLKMAISLLTFNELSGGRAQIVVGGGGGTAESMGKKPFRQVKAMRECFEILKMAANGERGSYQGEIFPIDWLDTSWAKLDPPMFYAGANGPQMLRNAARHAPGIMTSDFVPKRISWVHELIDPILKERGQNIPDYPINNFWAWHVKESKEEAYREARIWLCVRGTIYPEYIQDVVNEDEAKIVTDNLGSFTKAFYHKTPEIEGISDEIIEKIIDRGTSSSTIDNIDREVERFKDFERAGLNQIALKVYENPERAIRIIGEHIIPALID
ncbi:MAG: LLM class flavin-dependent oxidoreductase [Pseudomonadota bacterium]|nr:LLM class flavin-dependent oxidoreductase [Pseudomonadota bacterium]